MASRDLARILRAAFDIRFNNKDFSLLGKIVKENETNSILNSIIRISSYLLEPSKDQVLKSLIRELSIISNKDKSEKVLEDLW
jgi:hypothetical protein